MLTWTFDDVAVNADHTLTYAARADAGLAPGTVLENEATATVDGQSADASAIVRISENGLTQISKTSDVAALPHAGGSGSGSWTVTVRSDDPRPQPHTDVVDILPLDGARGSDFAGSYTLSGPVTAPAGATVYYTTADPADLHRDPAHASNGSAGSIAGNTVDWSTTFAADATAVRGCPLSASRMARAPLLGRGAAASRRPRLERHSHGVISRSPRAGTR